MTVKGKSNHYNVKFLKGYGHSISVKNSRVVKKSQHENSSTFLNFLYLDKLNIENFVKDLHKWNYEGNLDKNLEDYCKEKNISLKKEDKFSILYELVDSNFFGNLLMIGNSLEDVSSDDEVFLNLIHDLINKIGNDFGGSEIEKSLISFGEKIQIWKYLLPKKC